jgi:hypothetical protein
MEISADGGSKKNKANLVVPVGRTEVGCKTTISSGIEWSVEGKSGINHILHVRLEFSDA